MTRTRCDSHPRRTTLLPSAIEFPAWAPSPLPSSKVTNPRPRDAESPHPGRLQVRRHSLGPRAAPILPRRPLQCQLPAGLSLTDPGRCLRRPRRRRQVRMREAWQTLTAQRSIPPGPKLRPLGFLDPCAQSESRASRSSQLTAAHAAPPTRAQSRRGPASGVGGAESARRAGFRVGGACRSTRRTCGGSTATRAVPAHPKITHRFQPFRLPHAPALTFALQVLTVQFSGKFFLVIHVSSFIFFIQSDITSFHKVVVFKFSYSAPNTVNQFFRISWWSDPFDRNSHVWFRDTKMDTGSQRRFKDRGMDKETISLGFQKNRYRPTLSNHAHLTG